MPLLDKGSEDARNIDRALAEWRQGDVALDEPWFSHVADPSRPLTEVSAQANGEIQPLISEVAGLIMLTQSCDIVRSCVDRPFLEVAPLEKVEPGVLEQIRKGLRPAFAFVPATADIGLVADLDRVMTVEKAVAMNWKRRQGCSTDAERRDFAQALTRKRARFAFPDDFVALTPYLQKRIQEKRDRQTDVGRALRALREIRVVAVPSWDSDKIELFFWFIRDETDPVQRHWPSLVADVLKLVPVKGRFNLIEGQVTTLCDITAKDYVDSDPLDLDHLSGRSAPGM